MNWKKELEILKKHQKDDVYGLEICKDAEAIMKLIESQDHSGTSFSILANILTRLLKEKPLFPITDNPDEWEIAYGKVLQNTRMTSVFKEEDGTIVDVERVIFVDTYDGKNSTWHSRNADMVVDRLFPITLPYIPEDKHYYVYGKDMFLDEDGNDKTNENIGSYNYKILEYVITPSGEKIEINETIDERNQ